jgi:hypothetical protein
MAFRRMVAVSRSTAVTKTLARKRRALGVARDYDLGAKPRAFADPALNIAYIARHRKAT